MLHIKTLYITHISFDYIYMKREKCEFPEIDAFKMLFVYVYMFLKYLFY